MGDSISEVEQLVLLSLVRVGSDAYGVTVRTEIEEQAGRPISIAAVYAALDRLERRGYARSWLSDPVPERGGRARKHFRITAEGTQALREAQRMMARMWEGVQLPGEASSP